MTHLLLTILGPLSTLSHAAVQARRRGSWRGVQWVGGNAWECRSQARHFCNLAFPGLKQRFSPRKRTLPGRKRVLSTGTQPVNVNLVKITTCLEIQGTAAKMKGATDFCRGPMDFFYRSHYLKSHFNPFDHGIGRSPAPSDVRSSLMQIDFMESFLAVADKRECRHVFFFFTKISPCPNGEGRLLQLWTHPFCVYKNGHHKNVPNWTKRPPAL